jgi:hypothetical protein
VGDPHWSNKILLTVTFINWSRNSTDSVWPMRIPRPHMSPYLINAYTWSRVRVLLKFSHLWLVKSVCGTVLHPVCINPAACWTIIILCIMFYVLAPPNTPIIISLVAFVVSWPNRPNCIYPPHSSPYSDRAYASISYRPHSFFTASWKHFCGKSRWISLRATKLALSEDMTVCFQTYEFVFLSEML